MSELRQKQRDHYEGLNLFLMQPGPQKNKTAALTYVRTIPLNLVKISSAIFVISRMLPNLFEEKGLSTVILFALFFVLFEVGFSFLKATLCFRNIRKIPTPTLVETDTPSQTRPQGFGQTLNEFQEEKAIEITRLNMTIEFEPTAAAYIARAKVNHGVKEHIIALEDFNKALSITPDSVEAYRERANTYLAMKLKTLAKNDMSKAAALCDAAGATDERDKILEELRDVNAQSNPHQSTSLKNAISVISPLFTSDISTLQDKCLKDVEVDLRGDKMTASVYCRQAELLLQKKQFDAADEACDKAIALQPKVAEAYRIKSKIALQHQKNKSAALLNLDRAIEFDSKNASALEDRASLNLQLGRYQSALDDCTEAMTFNKSNQFKLLRASALVGLSRTDEALVDMNQFVVSTERAICIWNNLRLPLCRKIADDFSEVLIYALELRSLIHERRRDLDKAASDKVAVQKLRERKRPRAAKKLLTE